MRHFDPSSHGEELVDHRRIHVDGDEELVGAFALGFVYGVGIGAVNVLAWLALREGIGRARR